MLALNTPRALLMTATPHRGKEWLFRALLHLVDPDVYPPVAPNEEPTHAAKPGRVHFLRRMKEDLVDYDGVTKLFKGRRAANETVPLNPTEADFYAQALDLVDRFFPANAVPLGRMVYGKRAASSLYALAETLKRRRDGMGTRCPRRQRSRRTRTETTLPRRTRPRSSSSRPRRRSRSARRSTVCLPVSSRSWPTPGSRCRSGTRSS